MLKKYYYLLFVPCLFVLITSFKAGAPTTYITLQNQALKIIPKEFYIAAVEDGRSNNTSIGTLSAIASVTNAPGKPGVYNIDLKGGIAAIKNFVAYTLPVDKTLRPVIIKLNELKVTELPAGTGAVKGDIKLMASFYLQKGDDAVHLADYRTTTSYQRKAGAAQQIEPLIRSALSNCITYLNTWMDAQAAGNIKLAKSFKIKFVDHKEPNEGDTIYYDKNRPLKWDDFRGRRGTNSKYGAEIFAGLGYDEDLKVENSTVYMTFTLKVYVPKSACWVDAVAKNGYSLNHEQRHFDIAKLVAEHYKQKILNEKPTPDTYDAVISMEYLEALREMNKLQKQYDSETAHGADTYRQNLWNAKIEDELVQFGIKNKAS
ncbi:hypothetical protein ACFQZI_04020 [Mucilaginibacter lutimaris]|uniref:DUF922 domain-containing protein n=1 Tax=Mucilaginibacter lutimaris TaxID=931629 RepID=A0ABW2ZCU2_9SPHI